MIELIKGDITEQDVDCIVNAAHEALQGGGGVDGSIHRKAGPGLLAECRDLPEVSPGIRCPIGHARITTGHNLKAKLVIHTVAPLYSGWKKTTPGVLQPIYGGAKIGTEQDLANCYENCLELAVQCKLRTIAFPSLGTGGHAFPIELACPIAVKAMRKREYDFRLIRIVAFDDLTYHEFKKALDQEKPLPKPITPEQLHNEGFKKRAKGLIAKDDQTLASLSAIKTEVITDGYDRIRSYLDGMPSKFDTKLGKMILSLGLSKIVYLRSMKLIAEEENI